MLEERRTEGIKCLAVIKREEGVLAKMLKDDEEAEVVVEALSTVLDACDEFGEHESALKACLQAVINSDIRVTQLMGEGSTARQEAKVALVKAQKELLLAVAKERSFADQIALGFATANFSKPQWVRKRLHNVRREKLETIQRIEFAESKSRWIQQALEAEGRKLGVAAAAAAAEQALKKSRLKLKRCRLALEDDDGSPEEVEAATKAVDESRKQYDIALRDVLALRELGYPELRCSAAPKRDRFANVPEISVDELELGAVLGRGAFSDVFEASLPLTGKVAFKELRFDEAPDVLLSEAAAMWEVRNCDRVVQLLKVCTGKRVGLVMEFMEGGMLTNRLKQQPALTSRQMMELWRDVLVGVGAIHDSGQMHLDLKSDNVLLDGKGRAKVGDFGTCKQQRQTMRATRVVGTLRWLAPEVLEGSVQLTTACDVWSLGMVLYEMVAGHEPYKELEETQVVRAIMEGRLPAVPPNADADRLGCEMLRQGPVEATESEGPVAAGEPSADERVRRLPCRISDRTGRSVQRRAAAAFQVQRMFGRRNERHGVSAHRWSDCMQLRCVVRSGTHTVCCS